MKLVVFSDSHGRWKTLSRIMDMHRDADMFVFLGDGQLDVDRAVAEGVRGTLTAVRGNCDVFAECMGQKLLYECTLDLDGYRVMITHGHMYGVKSGLSRLAAEAKERKAHLVLYGHTHAPRETREDGVTFFNPGSASDGCFGVVYLERGGIVCSHGKI